MVELNCVGWLASSLPLLPSAEGLMLRRWRSLCRPRSCGPAVSSQVRIVGILGPPAGEGSSASEGWRCHSRLLELNFEKRGGNLVGQSDVLEGYCVGIRAGCSDGIAYYIARGIFKDSPPYLSAFFRSFCYKHKHKRYCIVVYGRA